MGHRIRRSIEEPIRRRDLSFAEMWKGDDRGLITSWEVGRKLARDRPDLADRALRGELPQLGWGAPTIPPEKQEKMAPVGWKGGVIPKLKMKKKYGSLHYLAGWQGIRGEDLDIDLSEEREIICSLAGIRVIFTGDLQKLGAEEPDGSPSDVEAIEP